MKNPLVSIGIPSYNRPESLRKTIKSVVGQTYTNIEIIISDNCSTNEEVEVVINSFLLDSRIKYFRQDVNRGPAHNFNFVLEKANGEYFKWLADDWIDNNYIEQCATYLENNPECSLAYGNAKICNLQGEVIAEDFALDLNLANSNDRIIKYFSYVAYNSSFYGIYKRQNFSQIKANLNLAHDWLIVARVISDGQGKLVDNTSCYLTSGGVSSSIESMTANLGHSKFVSRFFYLTVSLNIVKDFLLNYSSYKSFSVFQRIRLARKCFMIIYKRFDLKTEVKRGIGKTLRIRR